MNRIKPINWPAYFMARAREQVAGWTRAARPELNNDEVICPNCVHQFGAIPVNVQRRLRALEAALVDYFGSVPPIDEKGAFVVPEYD